MKKDKKVADQKPDDITDGSNQPLAPTPITGTQKQNSLAYVVGAMLLLIVVVVGSGVAKQKKTVPAPVVTPSPVDYKLTTLTVDGDAATVSSNVVSVPILIDTAGNTVSAVELHIVVDPSTVKGLKVQSGSFFTKPTVLENKAGEAPGSYVYIIGSLTPKQGSGDVAHVSWTKTAGASGTVTIRLDPQTQVAAIGETGTVLKNVIEGVVRF